jgi:hypothetical protein
MDYTSAKKVYEAPQEREKGRFLRDEEELEDSLVNGGASDQRDRP